MTTQNIKVRGESEKSATPGDIRILVAEDHVPSKEVMMQMLKRLGYEAHAVTTGTDALRALEREHFDVLLLDYQLPEKNGAEVSREVRARESGNQRLLIIAVSATASAEQRGHCLAAGMDDYLPKPVRMHQLSALLALRLHTQADERAQQPATAELTDTAQPLDPAAWQYLAALEDPGETGFTGQLIDVFLEDAEKRMQDIRDAAAAEDSERVARCAHGLKAGCLQVGANRMVSLCKELQQLTRDQFPSHAETLVEQLSTEYERVKCDLVERRRQFAQEVYRP